MKILGIGIDILEIKRIKKMTYKIIKKLSKRILTKFEFKQYIKTKNKINFLSKKFVAKEAASKALGTGIKNGIYFKSFEIYNNNKTGKPKIKLLNKAYQISKQMKIKKIHLSISDEKKYAQALVIIE